MMQLDIQTIVILVAIAALILLAVLVLSRRQRVTLTRDHTAPLTKRQFAPAPVIEDANLEAAALAAITAPVDPVAADAIDPPVDPLTRIKGLGPKAAARLGELGVTRYAQLAALDDDGIARIDVQMGTFKGRITRDRWVEQAALLAAGETGAFEAQFGRLG